MILKKAESHFVKPKTRRSNKYRNKTCLQKKQVSNEKVAMNILSWNWNGNAATFVVTELAPYGQGLAFVGGFETLPPGTKAQ